METRVIEIHYPSLEAETIGHITAGIREKVLEEFESAQMSYSFSSNKQSGYIMLYPTKPILSIRVSNHSIRGGAVDNHTMQVDGKKVTVNAERENGQLISETVLYDALEQIKAQCEKIQSKIIK